MRVRRSAQTSGRCGGGAEAVHRVRRWSLRTGSDGWWRGWLQWRPRWQYGRRGGAVPASVEAAKTDGGTSRHRQCSLSIGLGLERWGVAAAVNLVTFTSGPHLLFIWHCATGDHQPYWAGCPRSGRGSKAWANLVEINLTFFPLISTYLLNFRLQLYTYFFYHSITD
jgi:hypothetical protein